MSTEAVTVTKRSAVEGMKETSRQLRGSIADELSKDSDHFSEADKNLLKFHGTYQQEDRDARKNRKKDGVGKHYMFMVRCKIPGGRLTAKQYLAVDDLAGQFANGTLRLTTRQGIQLHGVLKDHLRDTIAGINTCLLSTLGACGDVERNVMACPAPHYHQGVHAQLQETAAVLAAHLAPRTRAYHEIWLNGKAVHEVPADNDIEPLYGKIYLPRKFKTGLALPEDNCIDVYAQDLGLLAVVENGTVLGYNVLVGGGMGMTHGNATTFPHLARPICYVPASAVVGAAEAVVKLFRDHGNRADRKRARIKYLVHDWGVEKFRQVLTDYIGGTLIEPKPIKVSGLDLHLGWHPQGNGRWYYGLSIENGRIKDEGNLRLRSGLRAVMERFQPALRITPSQDLLLCDLDAAARPEVERTLAEHGVSRLEQISTVQRYSMACPAVPTCGLAISEAERTLPAVVDQLESELKRLGLENDPLSVRMTGCPNGCARPYQSDIGLVGRSGDKYTVFVGGRILGDRLNFPVQDLVPMTSIVPNVLTPLLEQYKEDRQQGESFGDFCHRLGTEKLQALLPEAPAKGGHAGAGHAKADGATANGEAKANGDAAHPTAATTAPSAALGGRLERAATPEPQHATVTIPLADVASALKPATGPARRSETFLAGLPGEEMADYAYRYNSDGSIRETVVYFYGDDRRAATATAGDLLRREAVYAGKADPCRLHSARKLSDTYYAGPDGYALRDRRVEYHPDGRANRTVVFYYEGDVRAAAAPSSAAVRRQVVFEGTAS